MRARASCVSRLLAGALCACAPAGLSGAAASQLPMPVSGAGAACTAPATIGCFYDPYDTPAGPRRVLNYSAATDDKAMTHERCIGLCCAAGYGLGALAGVASRGRPACLPARSLAVSGTAAPLACA